MNGAKTLLLDFAANPKRPQTFAERDRLMALCRERGIAAGYAEDENTEATLLVSVGGDGAFIRNAKLALERDIPVLGVQGGRVGFLTEAAEEDFPAVLERLTTGRYSLEARDTLLCEACGMQRAIVNDVLVYKHSFSGVAQLSLDINGEDVGTLFGDGLIIATSTGSTGYSLSAGGPILMGDLAALVVTPICPHTLHFRPIVAGLNGVVTVHPQDSCFVAADGDRFAEAVCGDTITVRRGEKQLQLLRLREGGLFGRIREKLL